MGSRGGEAPEEKGFWPPEDAWIRLRMEQLAEAAIKSSILAVTRLGLDERLRKIADTDELSGLGNRRSLNRELAKEFERASRYSAELCMLMMDIDRFKQINDTRGHEAGDMAIRFLGACLLAEKRSTDFAARFGGDEFCVLMPGVGSAGGLGLAARLMERLRTSRDRPLDFTLSIGVASLRAGMREPEELVHAADRGLYLAKEGGRDRACLDPG
jgi:diguanylate cyclase (GGDEF)-like protein